MSPWVLRLKLNRTAFVTRHFRMRDIRDKILEVDPTLYIIESDDNADPVVIRIRGNHSHRQLICEQVAREGQRCREGTTGDAVTGNLYIDLQLLRLGRLG